MTSEHKDSLFPQLEFLPKPTEGVFHKIISDSLNAAVFVPQLLAKFEIENPDLGKLVVFQAFDSPDREAAMVFAGVYYEIFSRSAQSQAKSMMVVSAETISEYMNRLKDESSRNIQKYGPRAFHLIREKEEELTTIEKQKSNELSMFWRWVEAIRGDYYDIAQAQGNLPEAALQFGQATNVLYFMRGALYEQEKKNKL